MILPAPIRLDRILRAPIRLDQILPAPILRAPIRLAPSHLLSRNRLQSLSHPPSHLAPIRL